MRSGKLNRLVKVMREMEIGRDPVYNTPIYGEGEFTRFWAERVQTGEDESFAASQQYATRVVTFRTHYVDGLTETDTLVCDGQNYAVKGLREIGFRQGLEVKAEWQG